MAQNTIQIRKAIRAYAAYLGFPKIVRLGVWADSKSQFCEAYMLDTDHRALSTKINGVIAKLKALGFKLDWQNGPTATCVIYKQVVTLKGKRYSRTVRISNHGKFCAVLFMENLPKEV